MKKLFPIFILFILTLFVSLTACDSSSEDIVPSSDADSTINNSPTDSTVITVNDFSTDVDENSTNGTVLGKIQASVNQSSISTYEITSQSVNAAVMIDASTGELTIADSLAFDYEVNTSITGKVKITTADATSKEVDFTININNLEAEINITVNTSGTSNAQDVPNGSTYDYGIVSGAVSVTFKIENVGQDALNLTGTPLVKVSGDDYMLFLPPGISTIPAGGSTTFLVQCIPSSSRTSSLGKAEIMNDDTDENPYIINFTGIEAR